MVISVPYADFGDFLELSTSQTALQASALYLQEKLSEFVKPGETVLILFPNTDSKGLGALLGRAVRGCGGEPVFPNGDLRWKELLRLSFFSRASTVIASPLTVLGLSKLAAFRGVPLNFFNVVLTDYPCLDWMMDGISSGLDCQLWGILAPRVQSVIAGFSCSCGRGIHIREEIYEAQVIDDRGTPLPAGVPGKVVLSPRQHPEMKMIINASGILQTAACPCGNTAPKLVGMDYHEDSPKAAQYRIMDDLLYWNSILDCKVAETPQGLELEVVCFPGRKLPKFPACARLTLKNWDPEQDIPFEMAENWEKP